MEPSRADPMVSVLVDACGWVSLIDAGLNLDISLNEVVGKAELKITSGVKEELDALAMGRSGLLLDLCLLYTSPSPRALSTSRMASSA